ncbi:MAG: 7-cyano-7-deazaguanine synthase QueC [Candidatus Aminicenantes bacterium]|nr:7-cyano-7-deazaguanine synthase QueC [Candidatus Aminicenantes bacterium]
MKQAIVLFSGGIDSTTALYWARDRFSDVQALTFDYGQRHRIEIKLAAKLAERLNINQKIMQVDLSSIGGSSLTDRSLSIPDFEDIADIRGRPPSTYVPFRNGIFIALAAAWAEALDCRDLVCGFNVIDSPDYPDTRKSFVEAMEKAVNLGSTAAFDRNRFTIHAPFIDLKKSEIIKLGLSLGTDYSYAISCYAGREAPCEKCPACHLRRRAWEELGRGDPLIHRLTEEGKL